METRGGASEESNDPQHGLEQRGEEKHGPGMTSDLITRGCVESDYECLHQGCLLLRTNVFNGREVLSVYKCYIILKCLRDKYMG